MVNPVTPGKAVPSFAAAKIIGDIRQRQVFQASVDSGGPGDAHATLTKLFKIANIKGMRQLARLVPSIPRKQLTAELNGDQPLMIETVIAISDAIKAKYPDLLPDYE